jgi:hypothetical protein
MSSFKYTLTLAGNTFSIKTDQDEQVIKEAVDVLEQHLRKIAKKPQGPIALDKEHTLLLALDMACTQVALKNELDVIEDRAAHMLNSLKSQEI